MRHRRYPDRVVTIRLGVRRLAPLVISLCLLVALNGAATGQSTSPAPLPPQPASPSPLPETAPVAHPLSGVWNVLAFDAWNDGLVEPRAGTTLTAVFLTDGRLEGSTGCGTYVGGYSLDGERLGMGIISKGPDPCDVRTTEEAVDYSVALEAVVSWRAVADGVELLDDAGNVRVVLSRSEAAGLAGDWIVTRYARANGKPVEPLTDQPIRLAFGEDGSLQGSSGCRLLEGRYASQTDQVVIAPVETTGLPCEGDAKAQERRLLRIFEQIVFWQRNGDSLVLADASGAPLLELAVVDEPADVAVEEPLDAMPSAEPAMPSIAPAEPGG